MDRSIALIAVMAAACFGQTSIINLGGPPKKVAPVPPVAKVKTTPVPATEVPPIVVVKDVAPVPVPKVEEPTTKVVLELLSGERVDGMLQSATASDVRMSVAGQPLTISMSKVRAVYVGEAPKPLAAVTVDAAGPSTAEEAIDAIQALKSVTDSNVSYALYSPRVLDAKVKVDQYLSDSPEDDLRTAIRDAMQYYEWGGRVWHQKISSAGLTETTQFGHQIRTDIANACAPVKQYLDVNDPLFKKNRYDDTSLDCMIVSLIGPHPFWSCGAAKLDQAKKLLDQK